ncbi:MAG: hypothetical protein ACUVS4_04085 [Chloroflexaceae bacterium]
MFARSADHGEEHPPDRRLAALAGRCLNPLQRTAGVMGAVYGAIGLR